MKKSLFTLLIVLATAVQALAQGQILTFENPKVTVYLPPVRSEGSKAVVACPGGGYSHLATGHEGHYWAPFFNDQGITYAVLEYDMPKGDREMLLGEVEAAFKILKDSAAVWKIDPAKIGIMGSSAGGHLASTAATHPTAVMSPAFQILFYPVISLDPALTHRGTRREFIGENADEALTREWSSDKKVTAQTPRAILLLSADDKVVDPQNSIEYFNALRREGVPATMHIWPNGGHGWGYRTKFKVHDQMLDELRAWLKSF